MKSYKIPTILLLISLNLVLLLAILSIYSWKAALLVLCLSLGLWGLVLYPFLGILGMAFTFSFIEGQFYITGLFSLPYVDAISLLTFSAFIARRIWLFLFEEKLIKKEEFILFLPFLLFFISYLISLYNTEFLFASLKYALRPILFFYLMFVFLPYNIIESEDQIKDVLWMMLLSGMVICIIGILSLFQIEHGNFPRVRPTGIFDLWILGTNQNVLAQALVAIIPSSIILAYLTKQENIQKFILMISFLMILVCLGTFSRAAWIALFVQMSLLIVFFYKEQVKKLYKYIPYLFLFLTPFLFLMSKLLVSDISLSANKNRLLLSEISFQSFLIHPFIGNGAGMFQSLVAQDRWYINWFGNPLDAHGVMQKVMAEAGLLGLVCFVYLHYRIFHFIKTEYMKTESHTKKVILSGFVIMIVSGFVFQLFNTSYFLSVLWFPVGLALASTKIQFEEVK